MMTEAPLRGHVAVVAGATRGTGRGIAVALGEAGATVYCTGRSVRGRVLVPPRITPEMADWQVRRARAFTLAARPETIDETAEMVTARGGTGIAVRVDHTDRAEVRALFERVAREQDARLDILVNDVWGGDELTEWARPFWDLDLDQGFAMLDRAVRAHITASREGVPLMVARRRGLVVEITDGETYDYRGSLFYSLCKVAAIHLAEAMAKDLDRHLGPDHAITAVALTPGLLRSEAMLDEHGVTEERWRDRIALWPDWGWSESPLYAGRAVVALATDPRVREKSGRALSTWGLVDEYGFTDADGSRPHWGRRERN